MPGLPTLTGIGGSRGQIFLLLAVATGSFLTGRMEAMQVWGEWQQSSLTGPALWVGGGGSWSPSKLWSPCVLICEMESVQLVSPEVASVMEPGRQSRVRPEQRQ